MIITNREQLVNDWRYRGQDKYLMGKTVCKSSFTIKDGDHSHCVFCWAKFSCNQQDLKVGFCTEDRYHWICDDCFNDFRQIFKLELKS